MTSNADQAVPDEPSTGQTVSGVMARPRSLRHAPPFALDAATKAKPTQFWVRLSDEQVKRTLRRAPLFSLWLDAVRPRLWLRAESVCEDRALSRPLLHALIVLAAMPTEPPTAVRGKDIANESGLSVSSVNKVLQTLAAVGLLERNAETDRYRIAQWTI